MLDIKNLEQIVQNQKISNLDKTLCYDRPDSVKTLLNHNTLPFQDLLKQESLKRLGDDLKFSQHAQSRLLSREINLNPKDKADIISALNKLEEKGAKDALMIVNDLAMIVSVNNKTVITVMDKKSGNNEGIFTNIDSAVII